MDGRSWQENLRKALKFRVNALLIGDALVCDKTGWRVDCLEDANRMGERQFVISFQGDELVRRKRINSAVDYLVSNGAPRSLEHVPGGADLPEISESFLGFLPIVDRALELDTQLHKYCAGVRQEIVGSTDYYKQTGALPRVWRVVFRGG